MWLTETLLHDSHALQRKLLYIRKCDSPTCLRKFFASTGMHAQYNMMSSRKCVDLFPRRASARMRRRVTVLGLCVCVCLSVCLFHVFGLYAQRHVPQWVPTYSAHKAKDFKFGVFSKTASFKSYGVKSKRTSQHANHTRGLPWQLAAL